MNPKTFFLFFIAVSVLTIQAFPGNTETLPSDQAYLSVQKTPAGEQLEQSTKFSFPEAPRQNNRRNSGPPGSDEGGGGFVGSGDDAPADWNQPASAFFALLAVCYILFILNKKKGISSGQIHL